MPIPEDIRSLLLGMTFAAVFLCLALFLFWRTRKTYPGFGLCTLASGVIALGYLCLLLRGRLPLVLSMLGANVLLVLSGVIRLHGAALFLGRRLPKAVYLWPALFAVLFAYFLYVHDWHAVRALLLACSGLVVTWAMAWLLAREGPLGLGPMRWLTAGFFTILGGVFLCWVLMMLADPARAAMFGARGSFTKLVALLSLLSNLSWVFLIVLMNSERLEQELLATQEELRRQAMTDELTGLPNRRGILEAAEREMDQARQQGLPLTVLLVDIDHFKVVNDTYGHVAGDAVLCRVAQCCRQALPGPGLLGRLGGDEFMALMPATDMAGALAAAQQMRQNLAQAQGQASPPGPEVTLSMGATALHGWDQVSSLLERADRALYQAKQAGRDRAWGRLRHGQRPQESAA